MNIVSASCPVQDILLHRQKLVSKLCVIQSVSKCVQNMYNLSFKKWCSQEK